ncbi:MAG: DNA/RNA helicase domain-containing protein, partial [Candidatus Enteromonas sp.]
AHPSYQAYSYAETLQDFNEAVQTQHIGMHPCAYLHNYRANPETTIRAPQYREILQMSPAFLEKDAVKLREFIKKFITKHDDGSILYCIDHGKIRPSKALQDCVSEMLDGNEVFHMIDEQQVAYATIKAYADAVATSGKHVIIVRGGPGTGKTVIAIQLLSHFLNEGKNVAYVTKTTAVREVFKKELKANRKKTKFIDGLFKGSGCFVDCPKDAFDVLLADEAHRLNEKSGIFHNKGENQIKEIINAARVSVFFLDEDQVVTTTDIGSEAEIRKQAKAVGAKVLSGQDLELVSQFRCNGSDGYLAFLDHVLGIRDTANMDLEDIDYDFEVFDNPCEMREELRKRNGNNKARMVAGYTYNWVSKNDRDKMDICLPGGFEAQWNFSDTTTWAIDENSFDQVGCIHTSQGLEFDYVGVIIGQDLLYRNGKVLTDYTKRAKTDKSLTGIKKTNNVELADRIIRNTYRTLMSRGQKGCFVYCEDPEFRDLLKKFAKAKH